MPIRYSKIPKPFRHRFTVDAAAPFRRHLNRLEVEIGREDYGHLKSVELLAQPPSDADFAAMREITPCVFATSQNRYNCDLLQRLGIRVFLDVATYQVYFRLPERVVRFSPAWREAVLHHFFGALPCDDTGWHRPTTALPGVLARFCPDTAGGILLLRRAGKIRSDLPLLTATHCAYDPHTLEVTLWLLRAGNGNAAMINLGFSGREPLTDDNLEKLKAWGIPLNPSNIDVIYPYADAGGTPFCYKLEKSFRRCLSLLGGPPPALVLDIHGYVGTRPGDRRIIVGLGGAPPFPDPAALGEMTSQGGMVALQPNPALRRGLVVLGRLGGELHVQFRTEPQVGYHLRVQKNGILGGRVLDLRREVGSLLPGEARNWLPAEGIRWLPGAGGNALQRLEARRLRSDSLCLHVEIPTRIRREAAVRWRAGIPPAGE